MAVAERWEGDGLERPDDALVLSTASVRKAWNGTANRRSGGTRFP